MATSTSASGAAAREASTRTGSSGQTTTGTRPHLQRRPDHPFALGAPDSANVPPGTPLIFLDIDGVLNRHKYSTHVEVQDDLMLQLKHIIDRTQARVVWSTFWRGFRGYLDYVLYRFELGPSVGATPGNPTAPGVTSADTKVPATTLP